MIALGGGATATTCPWRQPVAKWQHAGSLRAAWGSMENQARIFDAVAEATRQEVLQPISADVLRLVPEVSLAHALDIIRLSKVTSWRERLGGKNIRAAQCETIWLLRDGASLGLPSPRTLSAPLLKAQSEALERGSKAYERASKAFTAAMSHAKGSSSRMQQLVRDRDAANAWGRPVSLAMLQDSGCLAQAFRDAAAAAAPSPAPVVAAAER